MNNYLFNGVNKAYKRINTALMYIIMVLYTLTEKRLKSFYLTVALLSVLIFFILYNKNIDSGVF